MSGLPEAAVDRAVLDLITQQEGLIVQRGWVDDHPCGCRWQSLNNSWQLCQYHDGMNDGIAMVSPVEPTERGTTGG